jgi:hypothetical protein
MILQKYINIQDYSLTNKLLIEAFIKHYQQEPRFLLQGFFR